MLNDWLCGSGTLIDAYGNLGILTAHHVAQQLDREPKAEFCLIIAEHVHRCEIERICVEHVPLGFPREAPELGPDLSFLKLAGESALATIKSKKSFYRVSDKSFDAYRELPLEKVFWFVAGAPAVKARPMTSKTKEGALAAEHLIAEAGFKELVAQDQLERLRLQLIAGTDPFPENYKGVSGGGVWIAPMAMDRPNDFGSLSVEPCHLAGVAYWQGDLVDGTREIVANGPKSLDVLLQKLR